MIVNRFWPDCTFLNGSWGPKGVDSYWVTCTIEEIEREVIPKLSGQIQPRKPEAILSEIIKQKEDLLDLKGRKNPSLEHFIKRFCKAREKELSFCFLISQDLQSIQLMPWYYPISGQWNAYSPFVSIGPVEIDRLEELVDIKR